VLLWFERLARVCRGLTNICGPACNIKVADGVWDHRGSEWISQKGQANSPERRHARGILTRTNKICNDLGSRQMDDMQADSSTLAFRCARQSSPTAPPLVLYGFPAPVMSDLIPNKVCHETVSPLICQSHHLSQSSRCATHLAPRCWVLLMMSVAFNIPRRPAVQRSV
jgi:hypothetical protein